MQHHETCGCHLCLPGELRHVTKDQDESVVMPYDRILLSRSSDNYPWKIISNPKWGIIEKACSTILMNTYNDYAEYSNSGSMDRMIRFKDIEDYSIKENEIQKEWVLRIKDIEV